MNKVNSKQKSALPLITIVTVVLNDKDRLESTIRSILNQTYPNKEFIVIDGGSTDGTIGILEKYTGQIDFWRSEPDKGLYDAMNKGMDRATGQWINFMNAGDTFYDNEAIKKVFTQDVNDIDIVFGGHKIIYDNNNWKICGAGRIDQLWKGMSFCHQSVFARTELMKVNKFNISNRIAADFEFLFTQYRNGRRFLDSRVTISSVLADGLSGAHTMETMLGQWNIVRPHASIPMKIFYMWALPWRHVKNVIRAMLPTTLENYMRSRL